MVSLTKILVSIVLFAPTFFVITILSEPIFGSSQISPESAPHYFESKEWLALVSARQAMDEEVQENFAAHQEITLKKGKNYSFDLDAFSIDPLQNPPKNQNVLTLAQIPAEYPSWMQMILTKYLAAGLSQRDTQILIWALSLDLKFEELSARNKMNLLRIFPDAASKFANRRIEDSAVGVRDKYIEIQDDLNALRSFLAPSSIDSTHDSGKEISTDEKIRPTSDLQWRPLPNSPNGIYFRMHKSGFGKVHLDLFVQEDISSSDTELVFKMANWIGVAPNGERMAISSPRSLKRSEPSKICEFLKTYQPLSCQEMKEEDRIRILNLAKPSNFPNTRYGTPEEPNTPIEDITDCSHFTQQIYHRAGFDYPYAPTIDIDCLSVLEAKPIESGKPGDLVLYPGHIGILAEDGQVISATRGGPSNRSTFSPNDPKFLPSITSYPMEDLGRPEKVFSWRCPTEDISRSTVLP